MADIDVEKLKKMASDITEHTKTVKFAQPQNNLPDSYDALTPQLAGISSSSVNSIQDIPSTNVTNPVSIIKNTNTSLFTSNKIDIVSIMGYVLPKTTLYLILFLIAVGFFIYYKL